MNFYTWQVTIQEHSEEEGNYTVESMANTLQEAIQLVSEECDTTVKQGIYTKEWKEALIKAICEEEPFVSEKPFAVITNNDW